MNMVKISEPPRPPLIREEHECTWAHDKDRPCWGKVEISDWEMTDEEDIPIHLCEGHAEMTYATGYIPKPKEAQ